MVPQQKIIIVDETTESYSSGSSSTMETIQAMKRQEATEYQPCDYLGIMLREQQPKHKRNLADADFRSQMVTWCYNLVDLVELNRETVSIAMNLVDRFIAAKQQQQQRRQRQRQPGQKSLSNEPFYTIDRRTFQLTTLAAMYLATKVHEPKSMDPGLLSNISQGAYSAAEIEATELDILLTLSFRVHPPTALSFVRQGVELVSLEDTCICETVLELARLQTEVVVPEYDFIHFPASHVAYWCLLNALQAVDSCTPERRTLLKEALCESLETSPKTTRTAPMDPELSCSVQTWLNGVITNGPKVLGLTGSFDSNEEKPVHRMAEDKASTTREETVLKPASTQAKGSASPSITKSNALSRDSPCSVSTTRKL